MQINDNIYTETYTKYYIPKWFSVPQREQAN